jgi:hypothetical protein
MHFLEQTLRRIENEVVFALKMRFGQNGEVRFTAVLDLKEPSALVV